MSKLTGTRWTSLGATSSSVSAVGEFMGVSPDDGYVRRAQDEPMTCASGVPGSTALQCCAPLIQRGVDKDLRSDFENRRLRFVAQAAASSAPVQQT
jgi:hypothetical protein